MNMSTSFAGDIARAANGLPIEAIVVEKPQDWQAEILHGFPPEMCDRTLTWEEARPLLDFSYDAGFGGQDCPDITAWTSKRVLFVWEYDGSTSIAWVPRNP